MRPTKLTDKLTNEICRLIEKGNYIETASAIVGISKNTLYDWLKRGRRARENLENESGPIPLKEMPFVKFSDAVEKALALAEANDLETIRKASRDDWKASAWRLERRFPHKWGRKERVDISADINSRQQQQLEVTIENQLLADPTSIDLVKELWRRSQEVENE